jgi:type IV pilus assembly protein PilV
LPIGSACEKYNVKVIDMGSKRQQGSSLIEVMVALFVLAIGLLGVLAMQSKSMQFNQSAHTYSQAVYLANDMAERIRTNVTSAASYTGNAPGNAPKDCAASECTSAELAAWDLFRWNQNVAKYLPAGEGSIAEVAANEETNTPAFLRITVEFDDRRVSGDTGLQTYTLALEI